MIVSDEYLAELNWRLREQPDYEDSMRSVAVPEGTRGGAIRGYDWEGASRDKWAPILRVVNVIQQEHREIRNLPPMSEKATSRRPIPKAPPPQSLGVT